MKRTMKITQASHYSDERLSQMVLYVAEKLRSQIHRGSVKLNKILFFADFSAFWELGRSISGAVYTRQAFGPVPARMPTVRKGLLKSRRAVELDGEGDGERMLYPRITAEMGAFSKDELAILDEAIEACAHHSGSGLAEKSHQFLGWQLAKTGESIPYETIYVPSKQKFTPQQTKWATAALEKYTASRQSA